MFKMQVKAKLIEKEQIINTSHISASTHHASQDSHLVRRQQAVHDGQPGLQLGDLTVQATNGSKHSVLLVPVVEEQVVARRKATSASKCPILVSKSAF